jgi:hypothetical protein
VNLKRTVDVHVGDGVPCRTQEVAPDKPINIAVVTTVARAVDHRPLDEPQLAVNPTNPNNWLAIAMVGGLGENFQERVQGQTCAAFVSMDGGKNWQRQPFAVTRCFNPWVVFTPDGQAVVSMLGAHSALTQQSISGLVVFRSKQGDQF